VIDGVTNNTTTVAAGTRPTAVVVNTVTDRIYVVNKCGSNPDPMCKNPGPGTVTVISASPDFSLGPASDGSTSATVSQGHTATYDLQVTPVNGLTGGVQLACSGAPQGTTCTVSPNPVMINGPSAVPFMVTVTTTRPSLAPRFLQRTPGGTPVPLALAGLLSLLIVFDLRKKRRALLAAPAFALVLLILLSACSGSGSGPSGNSGGTPTGTYTLTLTATASNVNHTLPLTLNVTQ
jgi:hypothetical protein